MLQKCEFVLYFTVHWPRNIVLVLGHRGSPSVYLTFFFYTHTCTNIKTCVQMPGAWCFFFHPQTCISPFDHSHTPTLMQTRGITGENKRKQTLKHTWENECGCAYTTLPAHVAYFANIRTMQMWSCIVSVHNENLWINKHKSYCDNVRVNNACQKMYLWTSYGCHIFNYLLLQFSCYYFYFYFFTKTFIKNF